MTAVAFFVKMKRTCILLFVLLFLQDGRCAPIEPIAVTLNPRRATHVLNDHFVSLNLNPTDLLQGRPFGMASNSTIEILKGLAPSFVRLGGTDTNKYLFKTKNSGIEQSPKEIVISEDHWKSLNDFLRKSGMDVVVCLNSAHHGGDPGKWDPRNTLEMISFSDKQQYNITWQLGYEPTRIENVSGTQFGKDISQLRSILNAFPRYRSAKIVGPDIRGLHKKEDVEHVLDILIESGPAINAVTWHPRWPHASAITPSDASEDGYDFPPDYLEWDRNQLHKLLQRTLLKKPFWISEPKAENTGSFAEGLIYARRLAIAAKLGIEVVMKQPSMQDIAHPKPEYWIALLHKKTMGRTLLDTRTMTNHSEVQLVIQCTNKMYSNDQDGGITVLGVNTAGSAQRAVIRGLPLGHIGETVHQYVLTGGNEHEHIFSQMAYLNGEPLLMTDDGKLPDLTPKPKHLGQNLLVKLPPYSTGFWVVPRAKVKICQQEPETLIPFNLEEITQNTLQNMNHLFAETLLNPIASKEEQKEESNEIKRPSRQLNFENLGTELKRNMEEINKLMDAHRNSNWRPLPQTESSENQLRAAERKIDGLVDDLNSAIRGVDQKTEFDLFLEKAGLKNDFGKVFNENREKREASPINLKQKLFFKEGNLDLAEIEKRFRKILAKHRRTMNPQRVQNIELGKLGREMHEDLLLKEITLLEKTEETLAEVMKQKQQHFEQLEELIHDELEQIKDEKLATLVEMKANDGPNLAKSKRDAGDETTENLLKVDPMAALKNFISKRKEELSKRRAIHEKMLEARKKQTTTTEKSSTTLSEPTTTQIQNKEEKRRAEVLKSMALSIDRAQPGTEDSKSLEDGILSKRKPRKIDHDESDRRTVNLPSVLIDKILDTFKGKDLKTFPATEESIQTTTSTELGTTNAEPSTTGTAESTTLLQREGHESTDARTSQEYTTTTMESTTMENATSESTTEIPNEERVRRDTIAVSDATETFRENASSVATTSSETISNTLLKKKSADEEEEEVLNLAGSTVKTVLDDFIPKAYDTAKDKIESLGLAEYLKNLGNMIEKLQHVDMILKDAAILTKNSSGHHIQKIRRNKRETEESSTTATTEEPSTTTTTTTTTTEQTTIEEIAEMMATDDALEKALDKLAENLVKQEIAERDIVAEDPITPMGGKERNIIKEIVNKLLEQQEPKRSPRHSYPTITTEEPVDECLKKLRPGVYIMPSKNMANVHAEQTAKSAIARKNGQPTANVLTLQIYYDKTKEEEMSAGHSPGNKIFGREWPTQPTPNYQLPEPYPTRYSMLSPNPLHARPTYNHEPYGNMQYETPNTHKESLPKLIPLTTWSKSEPADSTWQLTDLSPEKSNNNWHTRESSEASLVKKEDMEALNPIEDAFDRRKSIEPYWNKTIRDIYEETQDDPFWKFLKPVDKKSEEPEEHRKKRSVDYTEFYKNPAKANLMENYIIKQKPSEKYPLDSNRVIHGLFTKQYKKPGDIESSLEAGYPINNFGQPQTPQVVYPVPAAPSPIVDETIDQTISLPLKQIYDVAVDFVKRLSSAA